jgi:hypothetical protein
VSNVHWLRLRDHIVFVCANLRPRIKRFNESEFGLLMDELVAPRQGLGFLQRNSMSDGNTR